MRNPCKWSIVGVVAVLAFSCLAAVAQDRQPTGQNRNGAALQNAPNRPQDDSGGPAPIHDLTGTWIGPGEPVLSNMIPPMTPVGQARLKLNIPDPFSATSNDGWKTCDPMGMPRIVNNEIAEI